MSYMKDRRIFFMNKEKLVYGAVFTRGGVVRKEFGAAPGYLKSFIAQIQITGSTNTCQVRNDYVTYTIGTCNIYLAVYTNIGLEKEVESVLLEAKKKTEASSEGRTPQGIFASESEEKEEENQDAQEDACAEEESEDTDMEEDTPGWKKLMQPSKLLGMFSRTEEVSESSLREHFISRNIPPSLGALLAKEVLKTKKNDATDLPEKEKLQNSIRKVVGQVVPSLSPDEIIKEIKHRKETKKTPYVFCMIGVNGVGKSTTLSKLCLWILKNNFTVCVAACDGFRSGAIEQLRKYVDRYKRRGHAIHLYEKGYGKDESAIASKAITHAVQNGFDVVLIDTCGRMPSNASSMLSLSKMIRVNKPNKVLYVGEALVGTDSIEQIKTFNAYVERACVDKTVDGIVVTKCDTVDEKVGTILSLAHTVDKPVVFIGTGQKNIDLLPFDVNALCTSLGM
ncbi:signal recognition particle receptor subunit alpha [Nematocida sp. AWRm77]|nr:signal recognition particle receptor subunit alpha [Nematocida sp. AWRm77]